MVSDHHHLKHVIDMADNMLSAMWGCHGSLHEENGVFRLRATQIRNKLRERIKNLKKLIKEKQGNGLAWQFFSPP